ncbi:MAG: glycogen-binding domain-containing protein [Longimicrobiales bacterium]
MRATPGSLLTRRLTALVTTVLGVAASVPAAAGAAPSLQTELAVELGASQIGPPVGSDAESARFGVGGVRASHYSLTGSGISASVLLGRALGGQNGGDFLSASLSSSMVEDWGGGWSAGMDLRVFGFGVQAPFPYHAIAAEGGPTLTYRAGSLSVSGAAIAGVGRSSFEFQRFPGGLTRTFEDDLWRVGGTAEVLVGSGPLRAGVAGGAHETPGGLYGSGGGRIVLSGGWGAVELRGDLWSTPSGSEGTGGLAFVVPFSGWSLRGFLGKSEPDPLTLAEPGSGSGGLLVGRSLYTRAPGPTRSPSHAVIASTPQSSVVRMSIAVPPGAQRVEVLGDFTLWEPMPMRREGDLWVAEMNVGPGTHHFGYLVDGEWFVPDNEESVVADEWGRANAILVIEGENGT